MDASSYYWYFHPAAGFIPVQLKATKGPSHILKTLNDEQIAVPVGTELARAHESSLQMHDNMVGLQELSEPAIMYNLGQRFRANLIYTYISSILVSVNPFKQLSIYSAKTMAEYRAAMAARKEMPPHVYALADNAYRALQSTGKNQAVIISGESGAGKTEATKLVLQYLAEMSGQGSQIEQQVLEANPILEAFGNAKTVRNNNSSRFGKYVQVSFDDRLRISGARIDSYMLERSRIVAQSPGERNYHIFFQILAGLDEAERAALKLGPADFPGTFAITRGKVGAAAGGGSTAASSGAASPGGAATAGAAESKGPEWAPGMGPGVPDGDVDPNDPYAVAGMDDCEEYQRLLRAFTVLKVDGKDVKDIIKTTVALLHLGNVTFNPQGDGCAVANPATVATVAQLLGVDVARLTASLTQQKKTMGRETVTTLKSVDAANAGVEALVKAVYSAQFDYLIARINTTLGAGQAASSSAVAAGAAGRFVGVLDIFGFEVFHTNYFEQLCINYTNEKMQQHFNEHVFKMELAEYRNEGVDVDAASASYVDNSVVLALIEAPRTGILAMTDEELRTPQGSDQTLLDRMHTMHAECERYRKPRTRVPTFTVEHYAGPVDYTITGFLLKNKDTLDADLSATLLASSVAHVRQVFSPASWGAPLSGGSGAASPTAGGGAPAGATTIASTFKRQLVALMTTLDACDPHFIRCIKSNNRKVRDTFDDDLVLRQLRYLGLRDVVYIRQKGFPIRKPHGEFAARYGVIDDGAAAAAAAEAAAAGAGAGSGAAAKALAVCERVLRIVDPSGSMWRVGRGKVFYRSALAGELESKREKVLAQFVLALQAAVRCRIEADRFKRRQLAIIKLQEAVAAGDLALLEKAIDMAEGSGGVNAQLLHQAVVLRNKLLEQAEAKKALKSALAARDARMIELALQSAASAGLGPALPLFAEAKTLMDDLTRFAQTLKDAQASRRLSLVGRALAEAQRLKIAAAVARLEPLQAQLEEEARMARQLQDAMRANDLDKLRKALEIAISAKSGAMVGSLLDRARAAGLENDPLVAKALGMATHMEKEVHAFKIASELQAAIASDDAQILKATVAIALQKGFATHALVAQAQKRVAELEAQAGTMSALRAAIAAKKKDQLEAAIAQAAAAGLETSSEYGSARAALADIMAKQQVYKQQRRSVLGGDGGAGKDAAAAAAASPESKSPASPSSSAVAAAAAASGTVRFVTGGDASAALANAVEEVKGESEGDASAVAQLQEQLDAAEAAGMETEAAQIKARLDAASEKLDARKLLQASVAAGNTRMLDHAIARARKAGFDDSQEDLALALASARDLHDQQAVRAQQLAASQRRASFNGPDDSSASSFTAEGAPGADAGAASQYVDAADSATVRAAKTARGQCNAVSQDDRYAIAQCPYLRSSADFARTKWFGKDKAKLGMLRHSTEDIPTSLLDIDYYDILSDTYKLDSRERAGAPGGDDELKGPAGAAGTGVSPSPSGGNAASRSGQSEPTMRAIGFFKGIQAYMGDRKLSFPDALIAELLRTAQEQREFRDELYMQVMKQVTANPQVFSLLQGWRLLALFAGSFPPSQQFLPFLVRFLVGFAPYGRPSTQNSGVQATLASPLSSSSSASSSPDIVLPFAVTGVVDEWSESARAALAVRLTADQAAAVEELATYCLNKLPKTIAAFALAKAAEAAGAAAAPTSAQSVDETIAFVTAFTTRTMTPGDVVVEFFDRSSLSLRVYPWQSCGDIVDEVCGAVNVQDRHGLSLAEVYKHAIHTLADRDSPLDRARVWAERLAASKAGAAGVAATPRKLGFFARLLGGGKKDKDAKAAAKPADAAAAAAAASAANGVDSAVLWTVEDPSTHLVVRKRVFASPVGESTDPLANVLIFQQARWEMDAGLHYLHPDSAAMIASLAKVLVAKTPTLAPSKLTQAEVATMLEPVCPPNLAADKKYKLTPKKFAASIEASLPSIDAVAANPEQYVATAKQLPTFGSTQFAATQTYSKDFPGPVVVIINHSGVFVCEVATRASLDVHGLTQVLGWSHQPHRLSVQVRLSKPDKEGKTRQVLRFDLAEAETGAEICALLLDLATEKLKAMRGGA